MLVEASPAKLSTRAFDVLLSLIERRDRVVIKSEWFDVVWPGWVVEENNLQVHIWARRKLLGLLTISTIPGRGYRFTAALTSDSGSTKEVAVATLPTHGATDARKNSDAAATALLGREKDLIALPRWLSANRLVTIIGSGGIGKTTFAKAIAANLKTGFADGVWVVDLSALTEAPQLAPAIARALAVTLGGGCAASALAQSLATRCLDVPATVL